MLIVNDKTNRVANLDLTEAIMVDELTRMKIMIFGPYADDVWDIAQYDSPEKTHRVLMEIVSAYAEGKRVCILP